MCISELGVLGDHQVVIRLQSIELSPKCLGGGHRVVRGSAVSFVRLDVRLVNPESGLDKLGSSRDGSDPGQAPKCNETRCANSLTRLTVHKSIIGTDQQRLHSQDMTRLTYYTETGADI